LFCGKPQIQEERDDLFFPVEAPTTYRNGKLSDYTFHDTMAGYLIDMGVMCEPDSREPWFTRGLRAEPPPR
jgi:hypothetical protein